MEDRQCYVIAVVQVLAVIALCYWIFSMAGPWTTQRYIGGILIVSGVAGVATARYQLGKSFAIQASAKQLVTKGLYSRIRNPIYVFGVVLFAGAILILRVPVLWIVLAAVVIMQIIRARREARILEGAFGDAYREYRAKTWF